MMAAQRRCQQAKLCVKPEKGLQRGLSSSDILTARGGRLRVQTKQLARRCDSKLAAIMCEQQPGPFDSSKGDTWMTSVAWSGLKI